MHVQVGKVGVAQGREVTVRAEVGHGWMTGYSCLLTGRVNRDETPCCSLSAAYDGITVDRRACRWKQWPRLVLAQCRVLGAQRESVVSGELESAKRRYSRGAATARRSDRVPSAVKLGCRC